MVNLAPLPFVLATSIYPLCKSIIFFKTARPRPVPSPLFFVVKNGSNVLEISSSEIPVPVSSTSIAIAFSPA